jgi:hypothetical protein
MNKDSKEAARMEEGKPQIIQINEGEVHAHVDRLIKQTVEEMLNGTLDAEADRLSRPGATSSAPSSKTRVPVNTSASCTSMRARAHPGPEGR